MAKIPLVDLGDVNDPDGNDQSGRRLLEALGEFGFVSVVGHGVDQELFGQMRAMLERLFGASPETKQAWAVQRNNYRGFIPLDFFTPNRAEANGWNPDRYEGYKLHWECPANHPVQNECRLYGPNIFPPHVPEMAELVTRYWEACDRLVGRLLPVFADALGVDRTTFANMHEAPLTNMSLLHYPAQDPTDMSVGMHPHKDTNVLTFVHPGPVGGLKIRSRAGAWVDAEPPPEALLVNIGEMLELWSGGHFPATPHQVFNNSGQPRYSFPYFLVPNHRVVVEPLVQPIPGFAAGPMPVGELSAEVWRTNWPDETPSESGFDLGTLDRSQT